MVYVPYLKSGAAKSIMNRQLGGFWLLGDGANGLSIIGPMGAVSSGSVGNDADDRMNE